MTKKLDFDPIPLADYEHRTLGRVLTVLQQYRFGALRALPASENARMCLPHLLEEVHLILADIAEFLELVGSWTPQDEALIDVTWVHHYLTMDYEIECFVVPSNLANVKDTILLGRPMQ